MRKITMTFICLFFLWVCNVRGQEQELAFINKAIEDLLNYQMLFLSSREFAHKTNNTIDYQVATELLHTTRMSAKAAQSIHTLFLIFKNIESKKDKAMVAGVATFEKNQFISGLELSIDHVTKEMNLARAPDLAVLGNQFKEKLRDIITGAKAIEFKVD